MCKAKIFVPYIVGVLGIASLALGCDEFSWEEVTEQYHKCLYSQSRLMQEIAEENITISKELCRDAESFLDCDQILNLCFPSKDAEIDEARRKWVAQSDAWSRVVQLQCNEIDGTKARIARSARKRGGSSSRSRGSSSSRGRGSTLSRVASTVRRRGQSAVSGLLNRKRTRAGGVLAAGAAGHALKKKKKGSTLKKVGKFAVAGLAAYGTYKLAKKMSKGLRSEYDDDDCWDYSYFTGQYQCVCPGECNVYVGHAGAITVTATLVFASALFSAFVTRTMFI